jgi:hypothetical protein
MDFFSVSLCVFSGLPLSKFFIIPFCYTELHREDTENHSGELNIWIDKGVSQLSKI